MIKQRNRLAFILDDLGTHQLSFFLIYEALKNNNDFDNLFFYQNLDKPPLVPGSACMPISELYSYDGPAISTSLLTTLKLLKSPSPHPKFFYIWDLEWFRMQHKNYHILASIYRNDEINLICRSNEHADLIKKCWNKDPLFIIENCKFLTDKNFMEYVKKQTLPLYA